jgi:hypothetical protein
LSLNLDASIYGTLAEIGAGQEVARWFLSVGAASGTVAKTICAYDKTVSDEIYGAGSRYVSKERLLAMLDCEYRLLLERLGPSRGAATKFFVFADTVAARNFKGDNEQHGWMGLRFQIEPGAHPSQILLHVALRDSSAQLQQEAIGILGVNLIYAAFRQRDCETFLTSLYNQLSIARLEIDVIELEGPAFANQDRATWSLGLVRREMARAIVFDAGESALEPASALRKRPLVVMRGSFLQPSLFDLDTLRIAHEQLLAENGPFEREPATVLEMAMPSGPGPRLPTSEMLAAVERASSRGIVMVTAYRETYRLGQYLRRYTTEPVRFILNAAAAARIMQDALYKELPGNMLEGLGRLLSTNVKLYVAPMPLDEFQAEAGELPVPIGVRQRNGLVTLDDLMPTAPGIHLFEYLRSAGRIAALEQRQQRALSA